MVYFFNLLLCGVGGRDIPSEFSFIYLLIQGVPQFPDSHYPLPSNQLCHSDLSFAESDRLLALPSLAS